MRTYKKNACLLNDVGRIIAAMPKTLLTKNAEAALYLFSVCTGCRAISCSNIQLRDIRRLEVSSANGKKTLQIWVCFL